MDTLNAMLDKCRAACSPSTDAELARRIGVTRGSVYNWRREISLPDEVACAKIADLAGVKVVAVLGLIGEARAKTPEAKAVWRRVAQAAGLVLGALLPFVLAVGSGTAQAGPGDFAQNSRTVMIMSRFWRRLREIADRRHFARSTNYGAPRHESAAMLP